MRLATAAICMSTLVGCADMVRDMVPDPAAISEIPDASKAYLIIDAKRLPLDGDQPTSISLSTKWGRPHLDTSTILFQLEPALHTLHHLHFAGNPFDDENYIRFYKRRYFELEPGVIYFYGKVEVEKTKNRLRRVTYPDLELYANACDAAPELFERFEVVLIGPITTLEVTLPPCNQFVHEITVRSLERSALVLPEAEQQVAAEPGPVEVVSRPPIPPEELVCRREKLTGSHRNQLVCRTLTEIEKRRRHDQDEIKDVQRTPTTRVP